MNLIARIHEQRPRFAIDRRAIVVNRDELGTIDPNIGSTVRQALSTQRQAVARLGCDDAAFDSIMRAPHLPERSRAGAIARLLCLD